MQAALLNEIEQTIDRLVPVADFNALLKAFASDKAGETSRWGQSTRLAHFMYGGRSPHIDRLAALTELLVLALDIADDLQDRDNMDKSWMKCPPELALNAVMGLLMGAIAELGRLQAEHPEERFPEPGEISQIVMHAVNGQYRDLTNDIETEQDYISVVQHKSCMLLKLAYYMGYGAAPAGGDIAEQMELLAGYVGVVYQLSNDMRDVLRYDLKNDLLHRKKTLPILYLLGDDTEGRFAPIQDYYSGAMTREQFLQHKGACMAYIAESGCAEYTEVIQSLFMQKAVETLDGLPALSPWKEQFQELTLGPAGQPAMDPTEL
ncbi:polyprenyl synthetase family protein [Paenibacillus oceani]|uniref:Polyprenyl synthetase family protein n=1 Tax=Paenibacillus oceani TaxID=2772510 RepID=A0A927CAT7_9BACL|nr:polyprenyl synthetase family protein [Paenibacillus oceani]MBD2863322.1 polyprenyl synthetase family protein [Paenibacillus oceani]